MESGGKAERWQLSSRYTQGTKNPGGGVEPLRGSSLIASAGTDINMKDDEDMHAVFISLLCTILSPGKKKSTRKRIVGQIHLGNLHGILLFRIHKDALAEEVLG